MTCIGNARAPNGCYWACKKERRGARQHHSPWPRLAPFALRRPDSDALDIAIVGLHGRFPDADNLGRLWQNLLQGLDSISEIPGERWPPEGFSRLMPMPAPTA
ncbi:beta-ketoacyl synthase N-terminal-like domain-containing protein [Pseudomonas sp. ABY48]|uniref:beta-ketoacyl synthase N-terminal-like domain-containing protein n=1 Tax=Pseudomonas sp. ABY48 TaxID=3402865 RepID=UPI003B437472